MNEKCQKSLLQTLYRSIRICQNRILKTTEMRKRARAGGAQRARKFKKVQAKKLVKSNKSISRKNFFDQNSFFAISKMAKNQFLNWEKVQTAILFDFTSFFA